jgi:hypothetical protein
VDVATALSPEQLVGRQVRVLWPDDDAWYLGNVVGYDVGSGMHRVSPRDRLGFESSCQTTGEPQSGRASSLAGRCRVSPGAAGL